MPDDSSTTRLDCRAIPLGAVADDALADSETVQRAGEILAKQGFVVLDNLLPAATVRGLEAGFNARYAAYLDNRELDDALKVGNRRYMLPVELADGFADPEVYAPAAIVALARHALGVAAILEAFGAVVSLAGARQQHIHRDGGLLFESAISAMLPAHALTFLLPLVDMNATNGTTAVWPGSHRWKVRNDQAAPVALDVPAGSGVVWDFRLFHGGTTNDSPRPRPILYSTYGRHWYRDTRNFEKPAQRRLVLPPGFLDGVPEDRRELFGHLRVAD